MTQPRVAAVPTPEDDAFIGQMYHCGRTGKYARKQALHGTSRRTSNVAPSSADSDNDPLTTGLITEALGGDGLTAGIVSSLTGSDTLGMVAGLAANHDDHDRFGGGQSGGAGASGSFEDDHSSHHDHSSHDVDVSDDGPDIDIDFDFD